MLPIQALLQDSWHLNHSIMIVVVDVPMSKESLMIIEVVHKVVLKQHLRVHHLTVLLCSHHSQMRFSFI